MIRLKKCLFALLLAAAVMLVFTVSASDEWEDEESFISEEFEEKESGQEGGPDFRTIAGYDTGENYTSGDFVYELPEGGEGAVVIGYTGTSAEMMVPEMLDGYPVVAIGDHAFSFLEIEAAILPDTVRSIGSMAFYQCAGLRRVLIRDGVISIGTCCFGGDPVLAELTIPETVETVEDFAFLACSSLKEVSFGASLKKIGAGAFRMCAVLGRVTLPETAEVGEDAFTDCPPDLAVIKQ